MLSQVDDDHLSRRLASDPLVLASLGVWGRPCGVGAAGCYATMLGNDNPELLCTLLRRMGRITFECLVWLSVLVHLNAFFLIE